MAEGLAAWLGLREAADAAARSQTLTQAIADALPADRPVRILDLGTGTGSNVRYLSPRLPAPQEWLVLDRDREVLEELQRRMVSSPPGPSRRIEIGRLDLDELDDSTIFAGRHLVTASALLDLVSERWLDMLASRCRAIGAAALFALTYTGGSTCTPAEPEDDEVRVLLNRHQRQSDKGLGTAAGPDASDYAARCFVAAGYLVRREASDWKLPPDARELQRQLIEGWAMAAAEMEPSRSPVIRSWGERRLAHVEAGRSSVEVCHEDMAAWLPK
jgi:hypothetical protein